MVHLKAILNPSGELVAYDILDKCPPYTPSQFVVVIISARTESAAIEYLNNVVNKHTTGKWSSDGKTRIY